MRTGVDKPNYTSRTIAPGEVLLAVEHVVLSFGGVKAIRDVSFDIRKGEVRAIIGPNGAGKTSMLNVINGFYHPQTGTITYKGDPRQRMRPYIAVTQGIARTFQNVALFKGMSTLDNIMAGRTLKMSNSLFSQAFYWGSALKQEIEHREVVEKIIDFLEIQAIRKTPVGKLPYGLQKRVELGRALATDPELLLLDARPLPLHRLAVGGFVGDDPRRIVAVVDARLERLNPLPGEEGALEAADQLLGLAAEHRAANHLDAARKRLS